jgi:imidazole glycerol-phosphate synthase subunit HisH
MIQRPEAPEMTPQIGLIDYGMGNRRSVQKALERAGARVTLSSDPEALRPLDGLVLPGVGAFPRGMSNLRELGLDALVRERLARGVPVLGICLGMQLAFDRSHEQGGAEGLGLIAGEVRALQHGELKLPHIGWNEVAFTRRSPLIDGLSDSCPFYHVHSFAPVPADSEQVLGTAQYGAPFVTAVQSEGFYGVQFHPEKSSAAGLRLLENFIAICHRRARDLAEREQPSGQSHVVEAGRAERAVDAGRR